MTTRVIENVSGVFSRQSVHFLLQFNNQSSKGVRVQVVLPGATRTAIWGKAGTDIATLPPSMLMDVDEMVDAALIGLDRCESVTIPSLPDIADWEAYEAARQNMIPKLSLSSPAVRYRVTALNPIGER